MCMYCAALMPVLALLLLVLLKARSFARRHTARAKLSNCRPTQPRFSLSELFFQKVLFLLFPKPCNFWQLANRWFGVVLIWGVLKHRTIQFHLSARLQRASLAYGRLSAPLRLASSASMLSCNPLAQTQPVSSHPHTVKDLIIKATAVGARLSDVQKALQARLGTLSSKASLTVCCAVAKRPSVETVLV